MVWTRDRVRQAIQQNIPTAVKLNKLSFFSPRKVIGFGYCHVSRVGQLNRLENRLSSKSSWSISFRMVRIGGAFNQPLIDSLLELFPQKYDIDSLDLDLDRKTVEIVYSDRTDFTQSVIVPLKQFQKENRIQIRLKFLGDDSSYNLSDLLEQSGETQPSQPSEQRDETLERVRSLLPTWLKSPEVDVGKDSITLRVINDFADNERLSFLKLLLESQLGISVVIKQVYTFQDQLEALEKLLAPVFTDYEVIKSPDVEQVCVEFKDFPPPRPQLRELKEQIQKRTHLQVRFESLFEKSADELGVAVKHDLMDRFQVIDYCFVYYDYDNQVVKVLVPEEIESSDLSLDILESYLKESYQFPLKCLWVEDNPTIYLEKRIFVEAEEQLKLKRIKVDESKNSIKIYYQDPSTLSERIWRKIFFRFTRFRVEFVDSTTKEPLGIYSYSEYLANLDTPEIADLLPKLLPSELEVESVNYNPTKGSFLVKFRNLLLREEVRKDKQFLEEQFGVAIQFLSARDPEELIFSFVSELPDWLVSPRVTFEDAHHALKLLVQNDFEEEQSIQDWVDEQSQKLQVPIITLVQLPVHRIKTIVYDCLGELVNIGRLKIYPEKAQIYMEGVLRRGGEEEQIEDEITRIEAKTRYSVEPYIKRSKAVTSNRQTVHDILQELLGTYQFSSGFPTAVQDEIESLPTFDASNEEGRVDLRGWDCFSIDPTGSKAIDDCISVQRLTHSDKPDDILIGVHVADVSYFVMKDSAIDKEAENRSSTVYFGRTKYYPLLPEQVVNRAGLAGGEDRPAVSLFIEMTPEGNVENFWLNRTIIRNRMQMSYPQVNEWLLEQKGEYLTDLQLLVSLTSQIRYNRISRGSINLEIQTDGNIGDLADQIVSELMILANRLVGFHLQRMPGQKVFRNQHIPSYAFSAIQQTLSGYGYHLDILNRNPLTDLNRILSEAVIRGESHLIIRELRQFMSNAYYSHNSNGHQALGTIWYTQWTSPLRRYMDIIVHRLLFKEYVENLIYKCQYASAVERLVKIKVENDALSTKGQYLAEHLDKPLTSNFARMNKRQIVIRVQTLKALLVSRVTSEPNLIYLDAENGVELAGQLLLPNDDFTLIIHDFTQEKRDLFVRFGLLDSSTATPDPNMLVKAKIVFLEHLGE